MSALDRPAAEAWLDATLGRIEGTARVALGYDGHRTDSGKYQVRWVEHPVAWPADRERLLDDVERELVSGQRVDVFVCPYVHVPGQRRAKGGAVERRLVHADRDGSEPVGADVLAQLQAFAVESGTPGHEHVYIPLQTSVPADQHERLCRALKVRLGDADAKVSDNDVLRLPGTWNFKHDPPRPVTWLRRPAPGVPSVEHVARILGADAAAPAALEAVRGAVVPADAGTLPQRVRDALAEQSGDRSTDTARVVGACIDAGLSLEQTRAAIATRDDLADRLAERRDDDVWAIWRKFTAERDRRTLPAVVMPSDQGGDGWDEPMPLEWDANLPAYPLQVWPRPYREYIDALAIETQTPQDLAGSVVLGVIAACIGGRVRVRPRAGWEEPTNEYVAPAMASGARKSPVLEDARAPLDTVEAELVEMRAREIIERRTEREVRDKYASRMIDQASKDADPALMVEAQEARRVAEEIVVPTMPRLVAGDTTPEALVSLLAEQGGRLACISDEAGIFDMMSGRVHTSSSASRLDYMLQAFSGGTIRLDRQTRGPQHIKRPALTLVTTIQPWALRRLIGDQENGERGLNARVLWSLPQDTVGYRDPEAPAMPDHVRQGYRQAVESLARTMAMAEDGSLLRYDDGARQTLVDFLRWLEPLMRRDAPLGSPRIRPWASKLGGHIVRISAALHMAGHGVAGTDQAIDAATVERAVVLGRYYLAHSVAAHRPATSGVADDARAVLVTVLDAATQDGKPRFGSEFKVRDLHRAMHRRFDSVDQLKAVLSDLATRGWVRPVDGDRRYEIHPDARTLLTPGDSGDSGDSGRESAGQRPFPTPQRPVATPGDSGDELASTTDSVTAVTAPGDSPPGWLEQPLTCENAPTVTAVTAVTRVTATTRACVACGESIGEMRTAAGFTTCVEHRHIEGVGA